MSIKRIFIAISAIFAASAVFADNSSVTSKKYVDDLMSGYQGKLPGSGANTLMIYDDETGIGEKAIAATLVSNATGVPTVGAVKTGLDGVQDTITGTAGYVMTGTGNAGEVGERAIYGTAVYSNSLVTAETVNTSVTNAVNSSLIRVDENGAPSDTGTLWEINTDVFALGVLPSGYTQLEWIESNEKISLGIKTTDNTELEAVFYRTSSNAQYLYQSDSGTTLTTNTTAYLSEAGNWRFEGKTIKVGSAISSVGNDYVSIQNKQGVWVNGTKIGSYSNVSSFTSVDYFGVFSKVTSPTFRLKSLIIRDFTTKSVTHHYVPCKNSNDVYGVCDLVGGGFYTNSDATIIAGPPVGN